MSNRKYHVVIIGAGPVGISLALSLSALPIRLTLLEANPITQIVSHSDRPLSLTFASQQFFSHLNIWQYFAENATPIESVHISDRGNFGFTRINAKDQNVAALGYVVPATQLANTLNELLLQIPNLNLLNPAKLQALEFNNQQWTLTAEINNQPQQLQADLVIAADGTHSLVRKLLDIATETKDYQQSALVSTLTLARAHQNIAYERFVEDGAIAMLPLTSQRVGCVWTGAMEKITALKTLSDNDFLKQVQTEFGYRLGPLLTAGERGIHPLKKTIAKECVREGLVIIGNAAHTLHPIAAQGFNLGLGDIALLTEKIKTALEQNKNPGELAVLKQYDQQRQKTVNWIAKFTDRLTQIFSTDFLPLNAARNSGLLAMDFIPALKKRLAKRLMGITS